MAVRPMMRNCPVGAVAKDRRNARMEFGASIQGKDSKTKASPRAAKKSSVLKSMAYSEIFFCHCKGFICFEDVS